MICMKDKPIIVEHHKGGYSVVYLIGKFIWGDNPNLAGALSATFKSLCNRGSLKVVVDMSETEVLASNCIGALMCGHASLSRHGGRIVIAGPNEQIKNTLHLCRIDELLTIVDNFGDACSMLSRAE